MASQDFPAEIVEEILLLLPVKSLLRFTLASKSLSSLIFSSPFTKRQFNKQPSISDTTTKHKLLWAFGEEDIQFFKVAEACFGHGDGAIAAWPRLRSPPKRRHERLKILGSCDGMVAISLNHTKKFFVWNPLTGDYIMLPGPRSLRRGADHDGLFCGFGYDSWSDDYKLAVAMPEWGDVRSAINAQVLSLRGNKWRKVENPPYVINTKTAARSVRQCAFAGGAFHWRLATNHERANEVVAFDLKTEKFKGVGIKHGCRVYAVGLGVFEGKLCMVNNYITTRPSELWLMEEYGNVESWAHLFTLRGTPDSIPDPLYISNTYIIYAWGLNPRYQLASSPTTPAAAASAVTAAAAGEGIDPQPVYNRPVYSSHGRGFEAIAFAESLFSPSFYNKAHTHKSLLGRTLQTLFCNCSSID